ncbi:MAG: hypothetical protein MZV63_46750 [Marinilabiliales bacterium]|nr:hypothetical protein [Marinilabiliales bacterium]
MAMTISFSGSSHFVVGLVASQRSLQAEALAAGEPLLHVLGHGLFGDLPGADVDVEGAHRCSPGAAASARSVYSDRSLKVLASNFIVSSSLAPRRPRPRRASEAGLSSFSRDLRGRPWGRLLGAGAAGDALEGVLVTRDSSAWRSMGQTATQARQPTQRLLLIITTPCLVDGDGLGRALRDALPAFLVAGDQVEGRLAPCRRPGCRTWPGCPP